MSTPSFDPPHHEAHPPLRAGVEALTYASDDGTEYEHVKGCAGEPTCPACWADTLRALLAATGEPHCPSCGAAVRTATATGSGGEAFWDADDALPSLPDVLVMLEHVVEDLDLLDDHLAEHRHLTDDHGARLELHSIDDRVNRAWAEARLAVTGLRELLAVKA